jgi:hypothetical protein
VSQRDYLSKRILLYENTVITTAPPQNCPLLLLLPYTTSLESSTPFLCTQNKAMFEPKGGKLTESETGHPIRYIYNKAHDHMQYNTTPLLKFEHKKTIME